MRTPKNWSRVSLGHSKFGTGCPLEIWLGCQIYGLTRMIGSQPVLCPKISPITGQYIVQAVSGENLTKINRDPCVSQTQPVIPEARQRGHLYVTDGQISPDISQLGLGQLVSESMKSGHNDVILTSHKHIAPWDSSLIVISLYYTL